MRMMSLFSGIGGMDLGLERAGMTVVGQVEIDPYCRRVLAKHWPDVPRWDDVTTLTGEWIEQNCGRVDVIAGGFPCQDVSNAGLRAGISAPRSGLYRELVRCLRVVRPAYAVLENVAALLGRGMGTVLGDLAEIGYNAEWDCIPACALGASHIRERVWLVVYPTRIGQQRQIYPCKLPPSLSQTENDSVVWSMRSTWPPGPRAVDCIPRMDDGIPRQLVRTGRKDAHKGLGNAVVPAVAECVGRAVMEHAAA